MSTTATADSSRAEISHRSEKIAKIIEVVDMLACPLDCFFESGKVCDDDFERETGVWRVMIMMSHLMYSRLNYLVQLLLRGGVWSIHG